MNVQKRWIVVLGVVLLVMAAAGAGAIAPPLVQGLAVDAAINYQGRLTDPDGNPLDGTFAMQFQLYDAVAGGTLLWDSGPMSVDVDDGLFEARLAIDPANIDGQGLWLRMAVEGEWLTPRQELLPVPYAYSLRPGAIIRGEPTEWEGHVLQVDMEGAYPLAKGIWGTAATGSAVSGSSTGGWGLRGYTETGRAVVGIDAGTDQARGYGGWFESNTGVGVYGYSSATSVLNNAYTPGVYGRSAHGVGVYGYSDGGTGVWGHSEQIGVRGRSEGTFPGVQGESDGTAVYGHTSGTAATHYGVEGDGWGLANGVYGHQLDDESGGLGVYGKNQGGGSGVSGMNLQDGNGTWGYSYQYNGVGGGTNRADNNYGLYTGDNLYSLNFHLMGAMMQVVQNAGDEPLERGDLVEVAGMGPAAVEGGAPILLVRKATEAHATGVVGVAFSSYSAEWLVDRAAEDPTGALWSGEAIPETTPGPVAPGEYLLVVVHGPAQVKASAAAGAIAPGDLLSAAGEPGRAGRAAEIEVGGATLALPGTVVGKALEPLERDAALIYVFVTLQ